MERKSARERRKNVRANGTADLGVNVPRSAAEVFKLET